MKSEIRFPSRALQLILGALLLLVVLSPVSQNWSPTPTDDFPLSYYPMFSTVRNGQTWLTHPIGIRADGSEVNLYIGVVGTGGMNQVRKQINRLVRMGRAKDLCKVVAKNTIKRGIAQKERLVAVALVKDIYVFDTFFSGDRRPTQRVQLARRNLSFK